MPCSRSTWGSAPCGARACRRCPSPCRRGAARGCCAASTTSNSRSRALKASEGVVRRACRRKRAAASPRALKNARRSANYAQAYVMQHRYRAASARPARSYRSARYRPPARIPARSNAGSACSTCSPHGTRREPGRCGARSSQRSAKNAKRHNSASTPTAMPSSANNLVEIAGCWQPPRSCSRLAPTGLRQPFGGLALDRPVARSNCALAAAFSACGSRVEPTSRSPAREASRGLAQPVSLTKPTGDLRHGIRGQAPSAGTAHAARSQRERRPRIDQRARVEVASIPRQAAMSAARRRALPSPTTVAGQRRPAGRCAAALELVASAMVRVADFGGI